MLMAQFKKFTRYTVCDPGPQNLLLLFFLNHHLKAEKISFPLMYGKLLGLDNIWPRYKYLNIWNLGVQKKSKY